MYIIEYARIGFYRFPVEYFQLRDLNKCYTLKTLRLSDRALQLLLQRSPAPVRATDFAGARDTSRITPRAHAVDQNRNSDTEKEERKKTVSSLR